MESTTKAGIQYNLLPTSHLSCTLTGRAGPVLEDRIDRNGLTRSMKKCNSAKADRLHI